MVRAPGGPRALGGRYLFRAVCPSGLRLATEVRAAVIAIIGTMTVLVAYASRHGATAGIAAHIGARIADAGTAVDVRDVDSAESLHGYDAVILGAQVYDQSWPPEADQFVNRHRDGLAARPVWLFSVGSFGDTKRLVGRLTHKEPNASTRFSPRSSCASTASFRERSASISGPYGRALYFHALGGRFGDHPDWPVIDAWAAQIAVALARPDSARAA